MLVFFIDNSNTREFCLYKVGLHLLERGKKTSANNFIVNLNKLLLETQTHTHTHTHTQSNNFLNDSDLKRTYSLTTDLQLLHHEI